MIVMIYIVSQFHLHHFLVMIIRYSYYTFMMMHLKLKYTYAVCTYVINFQCVCFIDVCMFILFYCYIFSFVEDIIADTTISL